MAIFNQKIREFAAGKEVLKKEIRRRMVGYIAAGMGFVAGLAWNDAIKSLIEYLFPLAKNSVLMKFTYAVLLLIFITVVLVYLEKLFKTED